MSSYGKWKVYAKEDFDGIYTYGPDLFNRLDEATFKHFLKDMIYALRSLWR